MYKSILPNIASTWSSPVPRPPPSRSCLLLIPWSPNDIDGSSGYVNFSTGLNEIVFVSRQYHSAAERALVPPIQIGTPDILNQFGRVSWSLRLNLSLPIQAIVAKYAPKPQIAGAKLPDSTDQWVYNPIIATKYDWRSSLRTRAAFNMKPGPV